MRAPLLQSNLKVPLLRLRFGLGAKPAQERIDPAAQRCRKTSAIRIAVATESCNVQRSHCLGCLAAGNARNALLIRTSAASRFSDIQAHTLGSSQSLVT
jgi:hypothetical protein